MTIFFTYLSCWDSWAEIAAQSGESTSDRGFCK